MAKLVRSEYEYSDYEKYLIARQNTESLILNQSNCRVIFHEEDNTIQLDVDPYFAKEFEDDSDTDSGFYSEEELIKNTLNFKSEETREQEIADTDKEFLKLCDKFNIRFYDDVEGWEKSPYPYNHQYYSNSLSGSTVTYPLGEGLLDFIYFDVHKNLESLKLFMILFSDDFRNSYAQETGNEISSHNSSFKVKNYKETAEYILAIWEKTHDICATYFYNSLYTAAFPPIFLSESEKSVNRYFNYLIILQKEFKEKLEFCFDPDFYPSVLGHLYPSEKYYIYCGSYKKYPVSLKRKEEFNIKRGGPTGKMPFGFCVDYPFVRMTSDIIKNSHEYNEFNEKYCHGELDNYILNYPRCIYVEYICSSIFEMLNLEFTKMLEANLKIRKCKRCGRYFIMKGNYDTNYCDRVAEGETRTCQELAAQENYKAKVADNPALPIYSRYYKRYAARVRVHQIKEEAFKKWKYKAMSKRDECTEGKITPEEFTEWMESSFPNRKPKA